MIVSVLATVAVAALSLRGSGTVALATETMKNISAESPKDVGGTEVRDQLHHQVISN
jgi:hypothetical protein